MSIIIDILQLGDITDSLRLVFNLEPFPSSSGA